MLRGARTFFRPVAAKSAGAVSLAFSVGRAAARPAPFTRRWFTTAGQPIKCRAAVAWKKGEPLSIEQIEVAAPKANEVRVKMVATGVCHTDAFTLSGDDPEGAFPVILGHEGGGVVESVGDEVTSVKPGDHVIPLYTPECRQCKFCLSGKTNLCQAIRVTQGKGLMPDNTSRFRSVKDGQQLLHYMGTSTFSEYTVLPEIAVAKISKAAPLDKVCLLGCGVSTGIGAVTNTCAVEEGATVAVFGLGGVGLSVIQGAVLSSASRIVAIDTNPAKWPMAQQMGATEFVNPNELPEGKTLQQHLIDITDGGLDYTFESSGNVKSMRAALEAAHKGWGTSCIIGVAGAGQEISTRPFQLVTGRKWVGTAFGGIKGRSELPGMVDAYMDGEIAIDPLITHTFKLEDINKAFEAMKGGKCIRSVVLFD